MINPLDIVSRAIKDSDIPSRDKRVLSEFLANMKVSKKRMEEVFDNILSKHLAGENIENK